MKIKVKGTTKDGVRINDTHILTNDEWNFVNNFLSHDRSIMPIKDDKKAVFKFYFDYGRMGSLEGVFVEEKEKVEFLINSNIEVYFGEVLGKHSEVFGLINKNNIKMLSDESNAIKNSIESGYNPFEYYSVNFDFEVNGIIPDEDGYYDLTIGDIVGQLIQYNKK